MPEGNLIQVRQSKAALARQPNMWVLVQLGARSWGPWDENLSALAYSHCMARGRCPGKQRRMASGWVTLDCNDSACAWQCDVCRCCSQGWNTGRWSRGKPSFFLFLPELAWIQSWVSQSWELQVMGNGSHAITPGKYLAWTPYIVKLLDLPNLLHLPCPAAPLKWKQANKILL